MGKSAKSNDSRPDNKTEIKVLENVEAEEIESSKRLAGYENIVFAGIDIQVTEKNLSIDGKNFGVNKNNEWDISNNKSVFMKYDDKMINNIINGVVIKQKGKRKSKTVKKDKRNSERE